MAATNSPNKRPTVAVSYGFLGGKLVGRRLKRHFNRAGYDVVADTGQADILIAHSAGGWQVAELQPKLLVLVGLPLAEPGPRTSYQANRARVSRYRANRHLLRGMAMTVGGTLFYGLGQPRRNLRIIRRAKEMQATAKFPPAVPTLFIINKHDPWPDHPQQLRSLMGSHRDWTFLGLDGSHDDIWEHPDHYVNIIHHHARLLG